MTNEYAAAISREMNLGPRQAGAIVKMFDEGMPIPYIAKYRKEQTGSADETSLTAIKKRLESLAAFDEHKKEVIAEIEASGEVEQSLKTALLEAEDIYEFTDLYVQYRSTRKTDPFNQTASKIIAEQPSAVSLQQMVEPLAAMTDLYEGQIKSTRGFQCPSLSGLKGDELKASKYLLRALAEQIGSSPKARKLVRQRFNRQSYVASRLIDDNLAESAEAVPYRSLFDHCEPLRVCSPQRALLMKRGKECGVLDVMVDINTADSDASADLKGRLKRMFVRSTLSKSLSDFVNDAIEIAYETRLHPDISDELLNAAWEKAEEGAIELMADNVKAKLMARPLIPARRVMGVFPEDGDLVHVVCLDPVGKYADATVMAVATIHPLSDPYGSGEHLGFLLDRNQIDIIAVAEMPGAKTFENIVRNLGLPRHVEVHLVNARLCNLVADADLDADPSLAASPDAVFSRPVATGRIIMDPLVQYVKVIPELLVDPSLHPEEVDQKALKERLEEVIVSCVCAVGPDPNFASGELLRLVPGVSQKLADNIIEYRTHNAPFSTRTDLLNVTRMGAKSYMLCAGFLRIGGGKHPLDQTFVHPDRYEAVEEIAKDLGVTTERLAHSSQIQNTLLQLIPTYANRRLNASSLKFIVESMKNGGEDIRILTSLQNTQHSAIRQPDAQRPATAQNPVQSGQQTSIDPEFISTLHIGQIIDGRVSHLAPYGAFVNIGHNTSGLLHVSQMSEDFVSSPNEMLRSGQALRVRILDIDPRLLRIALTLKGVTQE